MRVVIYGLILEIIYYWNRSPLIYLNSILNICALKYDIRKRTHCSVRSLEIMREFNECLPCFLNDVLTNARYIKGEECTHEREEIFRVRFINRVYENMRPSLLSTSLPRVLNGGSLVLKEHFGTESSE